MRSAGLSGGILRTLGRRACRRRGPQAVLLGKAMTGVAAVAGLCPRNRPRQARPRRSLTGAPAEPPTPRLSGRMTSRSSASRSSCAGSKLSRLPQKCCCGTSGGASVRRYACRQASGHNPAWPPSARRKQTTARRAGICLLHGCRAPTIWRAQDEREAYFTAYLAEELSVPARLPGGRWWR